jgi:hypothetical protein
MATFKAAALTDEDPKLRRLESPGSVRQRTNNEKFGWSPTVRYRTFATCAVAPLQRPAHGMGRVSSRSCAPEKEHTRSPVNALSSLLMGNRRRNHGPISLKELECRWLPDLPSRVTENVRRLGLTSGCRRPSEGMMQSSRFLHRAFTGLALGFGGPLGGFGPG